ncbi:hypothetical protein COO60DRAFT_404981 [Scenedesmus sp. NREL 46B-D3]|nr:hypothetical protein COO60DRAFT_404981 [Scenedesmus sp. NREL 46B-D3]
MAWAADWRAMCCAGILFQWTYTCVAIQSSRAGELLVRMHAWQCITCGRSRLLVTSLGLLASSAVCAEDHTSMVPWGRAMGPTAVAGCVYGLGREGCGTCSVGSLG